jgi:hypothetical protein
MDFIAVPKVLLIVQFWIFLLTVTRFKVLLSVRETKDSLDLSLQLSKFFPADFAKPEVCFRSYALHRPSVAGTLSPTAIGSFADSIIL